MTIPSETNRSGPYSCNGATTSFPYAFKIYDEAHIRVILTDPAGFETDLTLGTDYSVSGAGSDGGGAVTTAAAYAAGNKITLVLNVPFTQSTDLENQGAYFAETIERSFDLLTQQTLQLRELVARSVVLPVTSSVAVTELVNATIALAEIQSQMVALVGIKPEIETVAGIAADVVAAQGNAETASAAAVVAAAKAVEAAASAAAAAVFDPSSYLSKSGNLAGLADKAVARANLALATVAASGAYGDLAGKPALGSAASRDVGTAAGQLVELLAGGKLPAVDGSLLTGILVSGIKNIRLITASGNVTPSAGVTKWVAFLVDSGQGWGATGAIGGSLTLRNGAAGGAGGIHILTVDAGTSYPAVIGASGGATSLSVGGVSKTTSNGAVAIPAAPGTQSFKSGIDYWGMSGCGGAGPFGLGAGGAGGVVNGGGQTGAGNPGVGYGSGAGGQAAASGTSPTAPEVLGGPGCILLWEF